MKNRKIRLYYGAFLSVFTVIVGILFIVQVVGVYLDDAFTRDMVAERLFPISIPFYFWIAAIIAGYVLSEVYPSEERVVNKVSERVTRNRLVSRIPSGSGDEYLKDYSVVVRERKNRTVAFTVCGIVTLICAVFCAVYVFNGAYFSTSQVNTSMLNMLINVGPWLLVGFASCIFMTLYEKYSLNREIGGIKTLMKKYRGNPVVQSAQVVNPTWLKIKTALASKYAVWGIRGAVCVFGVTFVLLGIFNNGVRDVLIKAINICMECIGLG